MRYFRLYALSILMLLACLQIQAREQMRINRVGITPAIPYSYDLMGVIGDSLALYNYAVTDTSVTIQRGIVTPDALVRPLQTVYTFTAPDDWEPFNGFPLYQRFKAGKLFLAFLAGHRTLVLITDAQGTGQHVFIHYGVNLEPEPGFVIVDEQLGWAAHFTYPGGGPVKVFRLDFNTDTLQPFYEQETTTYSGYSVFELAGGYYLMTTQVNIDLPDLLVHGTQIVNTYPEQWWQYAPYYLMSSTGAVTDQLSYISISDGLDRNQNWNMLAWVEDTDLITAAIPNPSGNPYSYGYLYDFVPYTSFSFSSIYGIGTSYPSGFREPNTVKNWQLVNGVLEDMGGFPDLSAYSGARSFFRLDERYAVAISQVDQGPHSFCLIDYDDLSVRAYSYQVGYYGYTRYSDDHFYLIGYDGRVHCFALELGSSTPDDQIPPPVLKLSIHPNPFRENCSIELSGLKAGPARLSVYNLRGQKVRSLIDYDLPAGKHILTWDTIDDKGRQSANGVYYLRLEQDGKAEVTKIVLMH